MSPVDPFDLEAIEAFYTETEDSLDFVSKDAMMAAAICVPALIERVRSLTVHAERSSIALAVNTEALGSTCEKLAIAEARVAAVEELCDSEDTNGHPDRQIRLADVRAALATNGDES